MSSFSHRISAWISVTAYGLSLFAAQWLHDHSHHSVDAHSHAAECQVDATVCACGHVHVPPVEPKPEPVAHIHSGCQTGHQHHHPHPSDDDGECPVCRYLAVKPTVTAAVAIPDLLQRAEFVTEWAAPNPDIAPLPRPAPRGPPALLG